MNNNVLLGINEGANKHYRSSYNGVSDGKSTLATNIVSLCNKYPSLSEEVNLYPLNDVLGDELAKAVSQSINYAKENMNNIQMNR